MKSSIIVAQLLDLSEDGEEIPSQASDIPNLPPSTPGIASAKALLTQQPTVDWEIVDLGLENSQYFQGFGTSFTDYEEAFVGAGDNPKEALEDALDSAAQSDWNVDNIPNEMPDKPSASGEIRDQIRSELGAELEGQDEAEIESRIDREMERGDYDLYYYVGLRLRHV